MKISRRTLRHKLEQQGHAPAPEPRDSFVNSLEQRLRSLDLGAPAPVSNVRQLGRGLSRGAAIGVVAALASGAAAAAVAIVTSRHDDPAPVVTAPTDAPTTTTSAVAPSTTAPETTVVESALPASTVPTTTPSTVLSTTLPVDLPTTIPPPTEVATTAPPPPTELPTTTEAPPITAAETTVPPPPETAPPEATTTSSTEVHIPATMALDCVMDATSITCSWTPGPDGTDHYVVLRSTPTEARGRVLTPDPGATTFVDIGVVPGNTYTYLVHALDAGEHSLAHSTPVTLPCCG